MKLPGFGVLATLQNPAREIGKILDRLSIAPSGNLDTIDTEAVRIAALQVVRRRYESLTDYVADMNSYVEEAVNHRAQLVLFPAYTGLLPFSLLPRCEEELATLQIEEETGFPSAEAANRCLSFFSDVVYEIYYHTMSQLAARHQVLIMAGSTLYFDEEILRHRAFLFDDTGSLVGFQDKVGLTAFEQALFVEEGQEINAFDTPLGAVVLVIAEDIHYYETGKVADSLGAQLLLHPTAFAQPHTAVDAAAGLNLRVQENRFYGVQSVLVGDSGLGLLLEGPCCVLAPNALLPAKNGIKEQGTGGTARAVLCTRLNLEALTGIVNPYTDDANPAFLEKYIDRLY